MDRLNVAAIGSCRVRTPLKIVSETSTNIKLVEPPFGYIHNSSEIVQALDVMKGLRQVPAPLSPFMTLHGLRKYRGSDVVDQIFKDVDLFVIEVSSVRIVEFQDWFLQINLFRQIAVKLGVKPDLLRTAHADPMAWKEAVSALMNEAANPAEYAPLLESAFWTMSTSEVVSSLGAIMDTLKKPVLFVGIFCEHQDGREINERIIIRDAMKEFANGRQGVKVLDPTHYVKEHGFDVALADLGHYRKEFEPVAGAIQADEIVSFWRSLHYLEDPIK